VKFAAIADWADSDDYPVTFMCRELGVSTSGYYDWRNAEPCARAKTDADLIAIMRKLHADARGNPGVRRMRARWPRPGIGWVSSGSGGLCERLGCADATPRPGSGPLSRATVR
jgi:hypothetical protein